MDYPLAPEARHPEPLHVLADGVAGVLEAAGLAGVPVVLAGDSAGAGLAVALARLTGEEQYAAAVGVRPPLPREQIAGVLLCCGVFSPRGTQQADRWSAEILASSAWALSGERKWQLSAFAEHLDAVRGTASPLPPTLLVSASGDPLHANQSVPFAAALTRLGSPVEMWVSDDPGAGHEFQFDLPTAAAVDALERVRGFLRQL